jgi:hypothetical protein
MQHANGLVPLSPPDVERFLARRRKVFQDQMVKYFVAASVIAFFVLLTAMAGLGTGSGCCAVGLPVGVVAVALAILALVSWGHVVEEPHGYWKRSDLGYDKAVENLEKLLTDEVHVGYERADVAQFFEVDTPTTFYLLSMLPPPVYIIVWRDRDKATVHLGPRTGDEPDRLKDLAKKISWSI